MFSSFLAQSVLQMNKDRKLVQATQKAYDDSHLHYKQIYSNFVKFEAIAVDYYTNSAEGARLITAEPRFEEELKKSVD